MEIFISIFRLIKWGGADTYEVSFRFVESEDIAKGKALPAWTSAGNFTVDSGYTDIAIGEDQALKVSAKVQAKLQKREIEYYDDKSRIERAVLFEQIQTHDKDSNAGTQDSWLGDGGIRMLIAGKPLPGFPGSIIPESIPVILSEENRALLNSHLKYVRMGPSTPAEMGLRQLRMNHSIYEGTEASNVWTQMAVEDLKAAKRGDMIQLGRVGLASIALRQAVAPISVETVESIVVDAIFEFVREHPDIGIGASGMRGSGSSWLAFPVTYTEDSIQQTLTEFEKLIERKVKETGGLIQFEEKPHAYRTSKIMDHGAYGYPVRPDEMKKRREHRAARRLAAAAKLERNRGDFGRFSDDEIQALVKGNDPQYSTSEVPFETSPGISFLPEDLTQQLEPA